PYDLAYFLNAIFIANSDVFTCLPESNVSSAATTSSQNAFHISSSFEALRCRFAHLYLQRMNNNSDNSNVQTISQDRLSTFIQQISLFQVVSSLLAILL